MRWIALAAVLLAPVAPAQDQARPPEQQPQQQPAEQQPQQPAEQQRQPAPMQEYVEFVKRVQAALRQQGFDPGEINGLDEGRTQAALAQFQLRNNLPASGSMDELTLKALGVERAAPEDAASSTGES